MPYKRERESHGGVADEWDNMETAQSDVCRLLKGNAARVTRLGVELIRRDKR
jgi:hypothetical protein